MRWITNKDESQYMRGRQVQNRDRYSAAEEWMAAKLAATPHKWTRQAIWGYRIFDFWCHDLGIAVEVDGPEHDADYDSYRDRYNFYRSALVVLRVRNFNEEDAAKALEKIGAAQDWKTRKAIVKPGRALLKQHGFSVATSPTKRQEAA